MTNVEKLAALFGGKAELADVCGRTAAVVTRWNMPRQAGRAGRVFNGGRIPPAFNGAIRAAAAKLAQGKTESEQQEIAATVDACLDPAICPTCGADIPEGRVA